MQGIRRITSQFGKIKAASKVSQVRRASVRPISTLAASNMTLCSRQSIGFKPVAATKSIQGVRFFATEIPGMLKLGMPALSPTMTEGNLAKWRVQPGDRVRPGDVLAEIETDKATLEFEAQEEGYVAKILVPGGTHAVKVGDIVAILVEKQEDVAKVADWTPSATAAAPAATVTPAPAAPQPAAAPAPQQPTPAPQAAPAPTPAAPATGARVFASPLAKNLAASSGVPLSQLPGGSGPGGRIIAQDVQQFAASRPAPAAAVSAPAAAAVGVQTAEYAELPLSNVRKVIAARLTESKRNVPHYYLTVECRVDELLKLRTKLNAQSPKDGYKLSVNDFIVKASALALRKVPTVNSSWTDSAIRQYTNVDISVAVQTENGLITPIVKNADQKGLASISNDVKTLAEKARAGKLAPAEFQGGSFTISNLGMFGIKTFSAIVNPPQACILAVGAAESKVVPATSKDGPKFEAATTVTVTLSCDHRVVDGAVGAEWLKAFKSYIEDPSSMLL